MEHRSTPRRARRTARRSVDRRRPCPAPAPPTRRGSRSRGPSPHGVAASGERPRDVRADERSRHVTKVVGIAPRELPTTLGALGKGRRRHGHDALPAPPARRAGLTRSRSTSRSRAPPGARPTSPTSTSSTRASARPPDAEHLTAVGRRLPRRLRAAARRRRRHRLDPPVGRHLRHVHRRGAGARPARRARDRPVAAGGARLRHRVRGARHDGGRRRGGGAQQRPARRPLRTRRELRRELKVLVRRRDARVPAPWRRPRRGRRGQLGSTLKIKPILSIESEILPIERVRTSGARVRAPDRLPDGAPRGRL